MASTAKAKKVYTFIDLFAGIGGFHLAFRQAGEKLGVDTKCVFVSEWDVHARNTYAHNFRDKEEEIFENGSKFFVGDIVPIARDAKRLMPKFQILTGGFPCQPFSQAGFKKGFDDERGNLFFNILEIIDARKPDAIFLENVRNLANHDNGKTFARIRKELNDRGYSVPDAEGVNWKIVKASEHGLPTHRPRIYIVAFHKRIKNRDEFRFPEANARQVTLRDMFGAKWPARVGYTLRVGGRGSGIADRRNWDTYMVDNGPLRIGPKHGLKMMGFPSWYAFPSEVSNVQAMKQLGNSVAVNAIEATAIELLKVLDKHYANGQ